MSEQYRFWIGNQTAVAAAALMQPFDYAVQNGFEAFEWFPDKKASGGGWDESNLDKPARDYIRETARQRGIRLSVHARWQANPLRPENYPLLIKDLELAEDLGAVLLNIHLYTEEGIEAYARAIAPLVKLLAQTGLRLSIENTPLTTPEHFNHLFVVLRALDSVPADHVGMCLDLGHANLCGPTHNNFLKYFDELDADLPINHLHFHENYGDYDSHLPLFTGPAAKDSSAVSELMQRLKERGYSGSIILEQWPQPAWLLNQARDRLMACLR